MPTHRPQAFSLLKPFRRRPGAYICPSCSLRSVNGSARCMSGLPRDRTNRAWKPSSSFAIPGTRYATTLASATVVNAPVTIQKSHKPLYSALETLKTRAGQYTNLPRVQLALRGLESTDPVTRIAVLSLNGNTADVRNMVRLLLADPLAQEQGWEKELVAEDEQAAQEGRLDKAVLVKFGEEENALGRDDRVFRTVISNSRTLQKENIEVLVAGLNISGAGPAVQDPLEATLIPALSSKGTWVTYPVHRAIIVGQGVHSVLDFGRFSAPAQAALDGLVRLAISIPASDREPIKEKEIAAIDVGTANHAVAKFREDISNAVIYEQGWFRSGLPAVATWLSESTDSSHKKQLKPAVRELVSSILYSARAAIQADSAKALEQQAAVRAPSSSKLSILQTLDRWAEVAHGELRDNLDLAFSGRHWRKLKWWKLFWRVDDVGAITSDVLERRWLTEAEKAIIWVAGRIEEAGYTNLLTTTEGAMLKFEPTSPRQAEMQASFGSIPRVRVADLEKRSLEGKDNGEVLSPPPQPWPQEIPLTRSALAASTIPSLQGLAQMLVVQTLSISSISVGLSTLSYFAFPSFGVLEASSIAALGITYSLRRMQQKWEGAREFWAGELREEGRKVLKQIEESVRDILEGGNKVEKILEGEKEREAALHAVKEAEDALSALEK